MIVLLALLFCTAHILPTQALAIVNAEDLDLTIDEDGLAGKLDFSVSGSSGNSDKMNGEGGVHVIWRHAQNMEMLVASFSYGKSRAVRDTNKSFVHFRHRYAWTETWGLEAFTQAQQNEFSNLKLRLLIGGGGRWSYQQSDLGLHVGLGSFYERESLRTTTINVGPVMDLWRVNAYVALHYVVNDLVRMQNTIYYQPAWKDPADYRLLNDAALHVALNDHLDLKLVIELGQDSRPPAGIKNTDVSYKTGLSYRF